MTKNNANNEYFPFKNYCQITHTCSNFLLNFQTTPAAIKNEIFVSLQIAPGIDVIFKLQ